MQDKNPPNVKNILLTLAKHLKVKGIRGLAEYLGESENRLYAWIRNGNIVDTGSILTKCPNIRRDWLKTGKGEMLEPSNIVPDNLFAYTAEEAVVIQKIINVVKENPGRELEMYAALLEIVVAARKEKK